jgi:hypothetical protein
MHIRNQLGLVAPSHALLCIIFASLMVSSHSANATPTLRLTSGATTVTCGALPEAGCNAGPLGAGYVGELGNWNLGVGVLSYSPSLHEAEFQTEATLRLPVGATGTLTIETSADGISVGTAPWLLPTSLEFFAQSLRFGADADGTVFGYTEANYYDLGNQLFALTTLIPPVAKGIAVSPALALARSSYKVLVDYRQTRFP